VLIPDRGSCSAGACRSTAASPSTRFSPFILRAPLYEASTRMYAIHPSGLPLACSARDGTAALGLSSKLHTPPTRSQRQTPATGPRQKRLWGHEALLHRLAIQQRAGKDRRLLRFVQTSTALEVGGDFRFEHVGVCWLDRPPANTPGSRGLSLAQAKRLSDVDELADDRMSSEASTRLTWAGPSAAGERAPRARPS
jgi:hypothetical protein